MNLKNLLSQASTQKISYAEIMQRTNPLLLSRFLFENRDLSSEILYPFLEYLSKHKDYQYRVLAAKEMGNKRDVYFNTHIHGLMRDSRADVRTAAIESTRQTNDPNWLPHYVGRFKDRSQQVRATAKVNTLKTMNSQLRRTDAFAPTTLKLGSQLMKEQNMEVATRAFHTVRNLQSTPVRPLAKAAISGTRRFRPDLYQLGTPKISYQKRADWSPPRKSFDLTNPAITLDLGKIEIVSREENLPKSRKPDLIHEHYLRKVPTAVKNSNLTKPSPEFNRVLDFTVNRVDDDKETATVPRFLYGGFSGMVEKNKFKPGKPTPHLSSLPGITYRFSVAISPLEEKIPGLNIMDTQGAVVPETEKEIPLQVALLVDGSFFQILDEEVKTLILPKGSEGSDPVHFQLKALKNGSTQIDVLIYYKGCLLMRGKSISYEILDEKGRVVPFEDEQTTSDSTVLTNLSYSENIETIADTIEKERFFNLLIEDLPHTNLRVFALLYSSNGQYHLESARVGKEQTEWNYDGVRERLEELVKLRKGLTNWVFLVKNFNFGVKNEYISEILGLLRDAGNEVFNSLFLSPRLQNIRKKILQFLRTGEKNGVFQVVSDKVFAPWQLMYLKDPELEPDIEYFTGMRFQIEQTLSTGVGLRWNSAPGGKPMVGFINRGFPKPTLKMHDDRFKPQGVSQEICCGYYSEDDLKNELKAEGLDRIGLYFYCHGSFSREELSDTWIKITDESQLTLSDLRKTTFNYETGEQNSFLHGPLIFLNVCESGQIGSSVSSSMVGFFLEHKKAGSVIAPESFIPAYFATDFASEFFDTLEKAQASIGKILFNLRWHYWDRYKNPLGLLYNLYSNAEFKVNIS